MAITIGWGIIKVRGVVFEEYWNPNNPFAEQAPPTEIGEPGPIVSQISWIDPESDETIEEKDYSVSVSIRALIENPEGGSAKITIEKEDGSEFENGKKHLDFDATVNSDGIAEVTAMDIKEEWLEFKIADKDKLIAKVEYLGTSKKSGKLTLVPKAKVLVNFRVHNNYAGEFGFDWLRMGDTGKPGDVWYKDIIGSYTTGSFVQSDAEYVKLGKKFEQLPHPTKTNDKYIVPVLTLLPSKKATLSLKVEVEEDAKKVEFVYDKNYLSLNQSEVSRKTKGKETLPDYLEVTCIKEFGTDQYIEVLADGEFAGMIKVLANDKAHRYKADVVFVEVKTNIGNGIREGKPVGRSKELKKYLNQAFTKPNFETVSIDLSGDTAFNSSFSSRKKIKNGYAKPIQDHLNATLYGDFDPLGKDFRKHYKIYFLNEGAKSSRGGSLYGAAYDIPATPRSVVVYAIGFADSTLAHETFHAMGLHHSFSDSGKFTFESQKTDNIMDYSDVATVPIPVISTYQWQWEELWKNLDNE